MHLFYFILFFYLETGVTNSINLCNKQFIIETERRFYKHEKMWVKMAYIKTPGTQKTHFGYILEGKRNDSLLMHGKLSVIGDTIIKTENYLHNINYLDSSKTTLICSKEDFVLFSREEFKNGIRTKNEKF